MGAFRDEISRAFILSVQCLVEVVCQHLKLILLKLECYLFNNA